jgi:Protein of unknown function (DUF1573)
MKTWLLVAVSAVVGVAFGVGTAVLQVYRCPWNGGPEGSREVATRPTPGGSDHGPPVGVQVDQETYNFGVMGARGTGSHTFIITNVGGAEVTLSKGETTCKCTKFELEKDRLQAGESAKVTVDWATKNFRGEYRQHATVLTSDTVRPKITLTIEGEVTSGTKTVPQELVLNDMGAGKSWSGTVQVFCYLQDKFELKAPELLDVTSEKSFEAKIEPMPATQLKEEKDARTGYLVHVTVKPGLPLGAFRQTIRMATTLAGTPEIEIPIHGKIVTDISITGMGWDDETSMLTLGEVSREEGVERTLTVFASGEYRDRIKLYPASVWPEDLVKVEIGQAKGLGSKVMIPVTIRIPKGSHPANHMATEQAKPGVILLKTNHPQAPELRIRVRFAVFG